MDEFSLRHKMIMSNVCRYEGVQFKHVLNFFVPFLLFRTCLFDLTCISLNPSIAQRDVSVNQRNWCAYSITDGTIL